MEGLYIHDKSLPGHGSVWHGDITKPFELLFNLCSVFVVFIHWPWWYKYVRKDTINRVHLSLVLYYSFSMYIIQLFIGHFGKGGLSHFCWRYLYSDMSMECIDTKYMYIQIEACVCACVRARACVSNNI
jgi:hypothetical protein